MPNWCNNSITLRHKDPAMIDRVVKALADGRLLNEFFPCPAELHEHDSPQRDEALSERFLKEYGATDWYNWQLKNWGTKWDVGNDDGLTDRIDENTVQANFSSAWAPPCQAYEQLIELGFYIKAYYNEPGMCFCGIWEGDTDNGFFDDYREYSGESSDTVREVIGEELDDFWCITEDMVLYEDDEDFEVDPRDLPPHTD